MPRHVSIRRARSGVGFAEATAAARSSHVAAASGSSRSRYAIAVPPAARNDSAGSPISLASRKASSPRETARSGITFARANTWTPYSICASAEARSLAVVKAVMRDVSRRISSM